MRICSFLPSATDVLYAIGLGDEVAGVTYECDTPGADSKPVVVHSRLPKVEDAGEIDRMVRDYLARGESLYMVDDKLLAEIAPDLIVTQDLCQVCAASPGDLASALTQLPREPKVLSLTPRTLKDVWADILSVGEATRRLGPAADLVEDIRRRLLRVERAVEKAEVRPRVLCLEWLRPPFAAGHWVPDMVELAGGQEVLGRSGRPSYTVSWDQVIESQPEVIIVCPCGYSLDETVAEFRSVQLPKGWDRLPAVQAGKVFAVDANHYVSRPSHHLARGVEIFEQLLHPTELGQLPGEDVAVALS